MIDNSIPVSLVDNTDIPQWEFNTNVVIDVGSSPLQSIVDDVKVTRLMSGCQDEPLLHFKLNRLEDSGEWVMGVSWWHILSDATFLLQFLNTLSRFYQRMESPFSVPVCERRLWRKEETDASLLPLMQYPRDTQSKEEAI